MIILIKKNKISKKKTIKNTHLFKNSFENKNNLKKYKNNINKK